MLRLMIITSLTMTTAIIVGACLGATFARLVGA